MAFALSQKFDIFSTCARRLLGYDWIGVRSSNNVNPPFHQTWEVRTDHYVLIHIVLVPAIFGATAYLALATSIDDRLAVAFFDSVSNRFPARDWPLLETFGHQLARSAVICIWLSVLAAALSSSYVSDLRGYTRILWATVVGMAIGPLIVALIRNINGFRCPSDLMQFGGIIRNNSGWFVSHLNAGHCFPSGHAAGGFCLVAVFFAGMAAGRERIATNALRVTLLAGSLFSLVRMAQGEAFLSSSLIAAGVDWLAAALVFAPFILEWRAEDRRLEGERLLEPRNGR